MAIPLQWQRVFQLGGDAEHASDLALPDLFSPRGSANLHILKQGEAESIAGYATLNSSAITTDTGASAVAAVGGVHVITVSGVTETRRDVVVVDDGTNEVEIWDSDDGGATWTFLKDMGSTPVGRIPTFAQHGSTLVICFGPSIAVQAYDGSSVADAGQTQPTAPSVAVGSDAGNLNGVYRYKVAIIDTNGDVGPASAATGELVVEDGTVDISSIATGGGSTKGRRIFRTTGDGLRFWTVADLADDSTTTFTDTVDDRALLSRQAEVEDTGDAPPSGSQFSFTHRNRVFYMDEDTIFPSDFGKPVSVLSDNSFKVGEGESGDVTRGGTGSFGNRAIIWREKSIWLLSGDGPQTWSLQKTEASVGAVSHRATVRLPGNSFFVDEKGEPQIVPAGSYVYLTPNGDVRMFAGTVDQKISAMAFDKFNDLNYANRAKSIAFEYAPYDWIVFVFPSGAATTPDKAVAWDRVHGTWHEVDFWQNLLSAWVSTTASAGNILMAGEATTAVGGSIYQLFTTAAADGSNITAKFRSNALVWLDRNGEPVPDRVKCLQKVRGFFRALGSSITITMNTYKGFPSSGASAFSTDTFDMNKSNSIVTVDFKEIKDSNGHYPYSKGHTLEWTITGQNQWALMGWAAGAQVYPASTWDPD